VPKVVWWHWECIGQSEFEKEQVELMSASNSAVVLFHEFPTGVDVHWETQCRMVWNEREHTSEERELVYEIGWVPELGLWRSFLRSQRKRKAKASSFANV
jgi:hypothetical protein